MEIKYVLFKELVRSLQKANRAGGKQKKIADKVKVIITDLRHQFANPFENLPLTNHGEYRLDGGIKYDLVEGID